MRAGVPPSERVDIEFTYAAPQAMHSTRSASSSADVEMADAGWPAPAADAAAAAAQVRSLTDAAVSHLRTLLGVCLECNLSTDRCHELETMLPPAGASQQALVEV